MFKRTRQIFDRFRDDDDGAVVSVEFILVTPLLALWFVGSFIFFDAYRSYSQTEKIAFTVSDIVSRYEEVDDTKLLEVFQIAEKMMPPRSTERWVRITSICFADNRYKVMWSYSKSPDGVTTRPEINDLTVPARLMPIMAELDSVVLTEVSARWTPIYDEIGLRTQDRTIKLVARPRETVTLIPKIDGNETARSTICPEDPDPGAGGGGGGIPDEDNDAIDRDGDGIPDNIDPDAPGSN